MALGTGDFMASSIYLDLYRIGVISLLALCPQLKIVIVNFLLHFCGEFWNLFGNFG